MEPVANGVRFCTCRLEDIREGKMAKIPRKFAEHSLATLKPHTNIHSMQADIIPFVRDNPDRSYVLAGRFGCGKSMLLWSLYRHAVTNSSRRVIACTLNELLNEYKAMFDRSTDTFPRLNAEELRQNHTQYAVFFDDIDKARPTEYTAEQFFDIVNAIYDFGHQLVVTTNLRMSELVAHFDRADPRYGGAIVRRLMDGAKTFEMF